MDLRSTLNTLQPVQALGQGLRAEFSVYIICEGGCEQVQTREKICVGSEYLLPHFSCDVC